MEESLLYVGTYTSAGSEGIHTFVFDPETGALSPRGITRDVADPSFLLVDAQSRRLYAVNELMEYEGKAQGAVSAFAIESDGSLVFLNRQGSHGAAPCHLSLDRASRTLYAANYFGGNLAALPLAPDGSLRPASAVLDHKSPGGPEAHAHCVLPDPAHRHVLAVDLGLDAVKAYRPQTHGSALTPVPGGAIFPAGTGPRQLAFHPRGRHAYVVHEHKPLLSAFAYDGVTAVLTPLQTLATLPVGFSGANYGAHLALTSDGRFLYASNRGHDSLAAFAVDAEGRLAALGHSPSGGAWPRHFAIDPSGRFLIAANQKGHSLAILRIETTGALTPVGPSVPVSSPVCVAFVA